jgi:hypothetical protein
MTFNINCQMPPGCVAADVSGRGLNRSPEGFLRTPRLYRTRLLRMSLQVSLFRGGFGWSRDYMLIHVHAPVIRVLPPLPGTFAAHAQNGQETLAASLRS